jgi:hypothetical protein
MASQKRLNFQKRERKQALEKVPVVPVNTVDQTFHTQ